MTQTLSDPPRAVLVTGAAGRIGSYFAAHSRDRYQLRLMVRGDEEGIEALHAWGEVVTADLSDLNALKTHCAGIDTIVHLAGDPRPDAPWDSLLASNIIGTYHVFAAAKAARVRRVVYASSIHAVSGYPPDVQVKTNEPVNPGDLYGVTKCFGEALGRYMAEQEGVSAISLRIGAFQPPDTVHQEDGLAILDDWVSHRDLTQLLQKCIDNETLTYAVFHGLSDNKFKRLDISDARALVGYAPQDNALRELPQTRDIPLEKMGVENLQGHFDKSGLREDA